MTIRIERPEKSKKHRLVLLIVILVVLVIGVAVAVLTARFIPKSVEPLAMEIVSIEGDVQMTDPSGRGWRPPARGELFREAQKLRTGKGGTVNFRVEDKITLRLKENAELVNKECRNQGGKDIYKLHLIKGVLLGATTKEFDRKVVSGSAIFLVTTPRHNVVPSGAIFRILSADGPAGDRVGVLRGFVEMFPLSFLFQKQGVRIRGLEQASFDNADVPMVTRVNAKEWQEMQEAYELLVKSAAGEAEQIDLSIQAGSFFRKVVFDHGTFFTPEIGYAGREFFKDPNSGDVILETEYDVFPSNSFVGVYIKTRNFDISKYEGLTFDVRRKVEEGCPELFFVELKSKGNVLRRFVAKGFHQEWTPMEFRFATGKSSLVEEVVFVFLNTRVGEAKKGILEFRNFNLIPKKIVPRKEIPASPKPVAAKSAAKPVVQSPPPVTVPTVKASEPEKPKSEAPADKKEAPFDDMVPQMISLR